MSNTYERFLTRVKEIQDLGAAMGLLGWDQEVFMPDKGISGRARQQSTLAALIHDKIVDPVLGDLVENLSGNTLTGFAAANVRVTKRDRDRAVRIPRQLVADLARETSLAQQAWVRARQDDCWDTFAPHLTTLVDLKRQEAEAVGYESDPYDALLDEFEPGAKASELSILFSELRSELVLLLDKIRGSSVIPDENLCRDFFEQSSQNILGHEVLSKIGFDFEAGRLDISTHPFTQGLDPNDVRITTRYDEKDLLTGLYANLHEGGHALYEMGLPIEHAAEPAASSVSLGIHESQSRMWENLVGRSREYLAWLHPLLTKHWPDHFGEITNRDLWCSVNTVKPSLIRIEADEVTYNLHIIMRMEIERALISGEVQVTDLPDLWQEKTKEYLGLTVSSNREGVLQDIHWAFGLFGYFPTYTLGNLYASQFFAAAKNDIPHLEDNIRSGSMEGLLDWLRDKIHSQGMLLNAKDLCHDVTGSDLSAKPFLDHLKSKFGSVYNLDT